MRLPRLATIDIGTNTLLLLIVEEPQPGQLHALHDEARFGRLGKGLDTSGVLDHAAIERCLAILRDFRATIDSHQVQRIAVVGTQALREAGNASDFLAAAEAILGTKVEVISGAREAELVSLAVTESLPELGDATTVIADVGGGSTELIVCERRKVVSVESVPIGSVRMTERHLRDDPPAPFQTTALVTELDELLAGVRLPFGVPLVATAGTATTMAALELGLPRYDAAAVHGHRIEPAAIGRLLARLFDSSVEERKAMPGMEPERADVIAGGVAIFARLVHKMGASEVIACDRGVRWGLAYELQSTRAH